MNWQQFLDLCRRASFLNFCAMRDAAGAGIPFTPHNAVTAKVTSMMPVANPEGVPA